MGIGEAIRVVSDEYKLPPESVHRILELMTATAKKRAMWIALLITVAAGKDHSITITFNHGGDIADMHTTTSLLSEARSLMEVAAGETALEVRG